MDEVSRAVVSVLGIVIFVVFLLAIVPWLGLAMEIYSNWTEEVVKRIQTRYRTRRMRREAEEADRMSRIKKGVERL